MKQSKTSNEILSLPTWAFFWIILSSFIVMWDIGFVLNRPRSLPGGDLHFIWQPYSKYITIDYVYRDIDNEFGIAQSWMNIVEVALLYVGLLLYRSARAASLLSFLVSLLFTFSKTVLYALVETAANNANVAHNDWNTFIFLYILPNYCWIVFPGILSITILRKLHRVLSTALSDKKKNE